MLGEADINEIPLSDAFNAGDPVPEGRFVTINQIVYESIIFCETAPRVCVQHEFSVRQPDPCLFRSQATSPSDPSHGTARRRERERGRPPRVRGQPHATADNSAARGRRGGQAFATFHSVFMLLRSMFRAVQNNREGGAREEVRRTRRKSRRKTQQIGTSLLV